MKPRSVADGALSVDLLERMAAMLKVLAHAQRLKVIELLDREGEAPVHQLSVHVGLPHAAMSQHLNHMKRVGLLTSMRRGKEVWYAIAEPRALTILGCMRKTQGGRS